MATPKKVQVTVHDTHGIDGDIAEATLTVVGELEMTDTGYIIRYEEQGEGLEGVLTELTVTEPGTVMISRKGDMAMELMLEDGRRHECHYNTPMGSFMMGVYTRHVKSDMSIFGGTLDLHYDIDFNAGYVSDTRLHITLKEIF